MGRWAGAARPTGGQGVQDVVSGANMVNLGGCPRNSANTVAVLVHYLTFGRVPELEMYNRPLFAYGDLIHDQCERRAYFDAGLFVEAWGDEAHRKGYGLYKMGCKGPSATYNCPSVRWNDGTSWPIEAGPTCIACASPDFWASMSPFCARLPNVPDYRRRHDRGDGRPGRDRRYGRGGGRVRRRQDGAGTPRPAATGEGEWRTGKPPGAFGAAPATLGIATATHIRASRRG